MSKIPNLQGEEDDDPGADVLSTSRSYAIRGLVGRGTYAEYMTIPARWAVRTRPAW